MVDTSHAWFMEDPYTKGLVKNIEIDLDPQESYNFIVVLKSEVKENLGSRLYITNVLVRSHAVPSQSLKVFCFGAMEVPKMVCPKEIHNKELGYSCLKVMMKRTAAFTPIKVILSNNGDLPVDA